MALISTIDATELKQAMKRIDRDNFSFKACEAIIDFYNELEQPVEFYPLDIDISYVEFDLTDKSDIEAFINDYGYLTDNENLKEIMEAIQEETLVICSELDCFVFDYNF